MALTDEELALLAKWKQEAQTDKLDDIEPVLREFGFDPKQRHAALRAGGADRLRRGRRGHQAARRQDEVPHQRVTLKRFAYYLEQRVPDWSTTGMTLEQAAATWAKLTKYDLDHAQRWWNAGINPAALHQIVELMVAGLQPDDLGRTVDGRTIAQHLANGSSVDWCRNAARWTARR